MDRCDVFFFLFDLLVDMVGQKVVDEFHLAVDRLFDLERPHEGDEEDLRRTRRTIDQFGSHNEWRLVLVCLG